MHLPRRNRMVPQPHPGYTPPPGTCIRRRHHPRRPRRRIPRLRLFFTGLPDIVELPQAAAEALKAENLRHGRLIPATPHHPVARSPHGLLLDQPRRSTGYVKQRDRRWRFHPLRIQHDQPARRDLLLPAPQRNAVKGRTRHLPLGPRKATTCPSGAPAGRRSAKREGNPPGGSRPVRLGKIKLRMDRLPQHKTRQTLLTRGTNHQIRVRLALV